MHLETIQHIRRVAAQHDAVVPIAKPLLLDLLNSYEQRQHDNRPVSSDAGTSAWIPITESMPETLVPVIVYGILEGEYEHDRHEAFRRHVGRDPWRSPRMENDENLRLREVTHWMPMPPRPAPLDSDAGTPARTEPAPEQPDFVTALQHLINCHSQENASSTPDFILAAYLNDCLKTFASAQQRRDQWYGHKVLTPVNLVNPVTSDPPETPTAPSTFESHGHTWTRHTPGDPCPVLLDTNVHVWLREPLLRESLLREQTYAPADDWNWGKMDDTSREIIGWRYASPSPSLPLSESSRLVIPPPAASPMAPPHPPASAADTLHSSAPENAPPAP